MAAAPGLAAPGDVTQRVTGQRSGKYMPPIKFGLGGVPLGNEFDVITDEEAYKTLDAAWSAGVRYYDVSPWYGLGRRKTLWVLPAQQEYRRGSDRRGAE